MSALSSSLGSAGYQPAAFGSLPNAILWNSDRMRNKRWRQAAANNRLAACAPRR